MTRPKMEIIESHAAIERLNAADREELAALIADVREAQVQVRIQQGIFTAALRRWSRAYDLNPADLINEDGTITRGAQDDEEGPRERPAAAETGD